MARFAAHQLLIRTFIVLEVPSFVYLTRHLVRALSSSKKKLKNLETKLGNKSSHFLHTYLSRTSLHLELFAGEVYCRTEQEANSKRLLRKYNDNT